MQAVQEIQRNDEVKREKIFNIQSDILLASVMCIYIFENVHIQFSKKKLPSF